MASAAFTYKTFLFATRVLNLFSYKMQAFILSLSPKSWTHK